MIPFFRHHITLVVVGRSVGLPFCRWCIGSARSGYGRSALFCTSPKRGIWRKYDATKSVAQLKYLIAIDFLSYRVLVINRLYAVLSVCTLHSITITYRWWSSKRMYLLQRVTRAKFMLLYIFQIRVVQVCVTNWFRKIQFLFTACSLDRISIICMIFRLFSFDNKILFWNKREVIEFQSSNQFEVIINSFFWLNYCPCCIKFVIDHIESERLYFPLRNFINLLNGVCYWCGRFFLLPSI